MDADLAATIDLIERWRDAGAFDRAKVAIEATRHIRSMGPARQRALAKEVAARVAPSLVPRITAEDGALTSEQVTAVVDLVRRADREQLDDLVRALREGDADPALTLASEVVDALDDADGDVPPPPGPPAGRTAPVGAPSGRGTPRSASRAEHATAPSTAPASDADTPAANSADASDERLEAAQDRLDELREAVDDLPSTDEAAEAAAGLAAARSSDRWRDSSPAPAPRQPLPELTFDIEFDEPADPTPSRPLAQRRHELPGTGRILPSPSTRPRTGATRPGTGAGRQDAEESSGDADPLAREPDGYRRRRAVLAALRRGELGPDRVLALAAGFSRATDRAWVLGAALDADLLDADDLDDLDLPATARTRLAGRDRDHAPSR